jgi:hypothetical protein
MGITTRSLGGLMANAGLLLVLLLGGVGVALAKRRTGETVVPMPPPGNEVYFHCWNCGFDFTSPLTSDVNCPNCEAVVFRLQSGGGGHELPLEA